jgi:hypothetical protein
MPSPNHTPPLCKRIAPPLLLTAPPLPPPSCPPVTRYFRFFQGRRLEGGEDERQISRCNGVAGEKGRWKNNLIGKCLRDNKEWDDLSVCPVVRQTLLHWAYELRGEALKITSAGSKGGGGKGGSRARARAANGRRSARSRIRRSEVGQLKDLSGDRSGIRSP